MLEKQKLESNIKARIEEIDAVVVKQQEALNQSQANLIALTGAKNELDRLLKLLDEMLCDKPQDDVAAAANCC